MTKVYISADIEGVNGVVYPHQTDFSDSQSYICAQKQMHAELNCIIKTLLEQGIIDITLNDAHGSMENLKITELNQNVELITGKPKPVSMMAGLDNSYDCAIFTGYHAKASSKEGVLAHTFSGIFNDVTLNGKSIGEIELNAIYAGLLGVPVILVTGDNVCCQEAMGIMPDAVTVTTKTAISGTSAKCRANNELFKELKEKTILALKNKENWGIFSQNPPFTLEIEFKERKSAELASLLPNIERISSRRIKFDSEEYTQIYKLLQFFAATLT